MLFERYTKFISVVPEVPEILLESCSKQSAITRKRIIQKQRIITIIPLIHEDQYPTVIIPPRRDLFASLHLQPDFSSDTIMPQQLQFITFLVSFIKSHPELVTKALEAQFNDQHNNLFIFMCYSVIPSFFGFFSSSELISHGFSFYCSLVTLSTNERLIDQALIPFFCNSCTYRYIEMIYYQFGIHFCHNSHLETKQIQKDILRKQYLTPLIESIIQSYPLIPHTHKFLLKYMISNGRNPKSVLHFFLHRFTFPQLLRYFKRTAFTSHFIQLKSLMISLRDDITPCLKIIDIFDSPSLFEVPSMFTVFDLQFTQLLLTSADVHVMMKALESVCELPACLRSFRDTSYFAEIKYVPFWVKVFSRNPKPPDSAFNWRRVVFSRLFPEVSEPIVSQMQPNIDSNQSSIVSSAQEKDRVGENTNTSDSQCGNDEVKLNSSNKSGQEKGDDVVDQNSNVSNNQYGNDEVKLNSCIKNAQVKDDVVVDQNSNVSNNQCGNNDVKLNSSNKSGQEKGDDDVDQNSNVSNSQCGNDDVKLNSSNKSGQEKGDDAVDQNSNVSNNQCGNDDMKLNSCIKNAQVKDDDVDQKSISADSQRANDGFNSKTRFASADIKSKDDVIQKPVSVDIRRAKHTLTVSGDMARNKAASKMNSDPSFNNTKHAKIIIAGPQSPKSKSAPLKRHSSYSGSRPVFNYNYLNDDDEDSSDDDDVNPSDSHFERIYLEITSHCTKESVRPVSFLNDDFKSTSLHIYRDHVMSLLDASSRASFFEYTLKREVKDLIGRSKTFELYLVHSLSLETLVQFDGIAASNYTMMVTPIVHSNMQNFLKRRISGTVEGIQKVITESLDGIDQPPVFVVQTLFMMAINHVLNSVIPSNLFKKLNAFEKLWENHLLASNEKVMNILPRIFQSTPLLNRKLRETIEHLKCIKTVKFEWSLNLIIESLSQFDEMIKYDNSENSIIQFALVSCNNVSFISRFIIINIFVVRQKAFNVMENESRDTYLWSRLESSILKLLASNVELLTQFVKLQDELSKYQIS